MSNAAGRFEQGWKRDVPILGSMGTHGALIHCFSESKAGSRVSVVSSPCGSATGSLMGALLKGQGATVM